MSFIEEVANWLHQGETPTQWGPVDSEMAQKSDATIRGDEYAVDTIIATALVYQRPKEQLAATAKAMVEVSMAQETPAVQAVAPALETVRQHSPVRYIHPDLITVPEAVLTQQTSDHPTIAESQPVNAQSFEGESVAQTQPVNYIHPQQAAALEAAQAYVNRVHEEMAAVQQSPLHADGVAE